MATGIPEGVTPEKSLDLESLLSTLIETLHSDKKKQVIEYKKELRDVKGLLTDLKSDSAQKNSFNLDSEVVNKYTSEYKLTIEAALDKLSTTISTIVDRLKEISDSNEVKNNSDLKSKIDIQASLDEIKKINDSQLETTKNSNDLEVKRSKNAVLENPKSLVAPNVVVNTGLDSSKAKTTPEPAKNSVKTEVIKKISSPAVENNKNSTLETPYSSEPEEKAKSKEVSEMLEKIKSSFGSFSDSLLDSSLGAFNLVTKPLEEVFGFNTTKLVKSGITNIFDSKKKEKTSDKDFIEKRTRPDKSTLKNAGIIGASAVFIGNTLNNLLNKGSSAVSGIGETAKSSLSGDVIQGLTTGGIASGKLSKVAGVATKGLSIASIASGVVLAVLDSISAMAKSEEWNTSKVSAGLAGFLAGSGSKGIEGAFKNAGKWALVGAGVGTLVAPVVGTLVGGLLGAAVGGVLGWIGAENFAKTFDKIGSWFSNKWKMVTNVFTKDIPEMASSVWTSVTSKVDFLYTTVKSLLSSTWNIAYDKVSSSFFKVKTFFTETVPNWIEDKYTLATTRITSFLDSTKSTISTNFLKVKSFFVTYLPSRLSEGYQNVKTATIDILDRAIKPFSSMYKNIKTFFIETAPLTVQSIVASTKTEFLTLIEKPKTLLFGLFDKVKTALSDPNLITDILTNIKTGFFSVVSKPEQVLTSLFTDVKDYISNSNLVTNILANIKTEFDLFISTPKDILSNLFTKVKTSVSDPNLASEMIETVKEKIKGVFSSIGDSILSFTDRLNPLNWFNNDKDSSQNSKSSMPNPKPIKVDDAVIYKDGNFYKPSKDDNIVATKAAPHVFDKTEHVVKTEVVQEKKAEKETEEDSTDPVKKTKNEDLDKVINLLSSMLDVLKNKDMAPSYTQVVGSSGLDFNSVR